MSNELEIVIKERDSRIEQLERRIEYCEEVARQYERMFRQLEEKMKSFSDRANNIQAVYDYLTRVGSDLSNKKSREKRFLTPMSDKQEIELKKTFKFKAGDEVFYVNTNDQIVTYHIVNAVEVMDKHPRYVISGISGYINEYKLFGCEKEAAEQLYKWTGKIYERNGA